MKLTNLLKTKLINKSKIGIALFTALSAIFVFSCSESKKEEFTVIKNVKVGAFNPSLAESGKKIFAEKCASCHRMDEKLVGPPLRDVVKRRSADYVFSQILDPEKMMANNDTTKSLLSVYMTQMPNQHLTMPDAKAVYDYLRQEAGVK